MTTATSTQPPTQASARTLAELGLGWYAASGQASLSGALLALADDCDAAFVTLARLWGATEERHPATLPAQDLQRVNYLRSFPHQATFAVGLDREPDHLREFLAGPVLTGTGRLAPGPLTPITQVLTPAACYHLYRAHRDEDLAHPRYLTTRNTCFRQEDTYVALRRQWSFTMREVVCLGTQAEVTAFLDQARAVADALLREIDLPVTWLTATDPFFAPQQHPGYLMQKVAPTKHEATYGDGLAIGSANLHHDHFGHAFGITRTGAPAASACLAFGVERWLAAILDRHGTDPTGWPWVAAAARTLASLR